MQGLKELVRDFFYFQGTSADQDNRFADKKKKLMKQMKFAENIETRVRLAIWKNV